MCNVYSRNDNSTQENAIKEAVRQFRRREKEASCKYTKSSESTEHSKNKYTKSTVAEDIRRRTNKRQWQFSETRQGKTSKTG